MEDINKYIQEIAIRNGVLLQKNDPVLLLHTFLDIFLRDFAEYQKKSVQETASRMEAEFATWETAVTAKANRVLTASIQTAQAGAAAQFDAGAKSLLEAMNKAIDSHKNYMAEIQMRTYRFAVANVFCSALLAIASIFIFLAAP